MENEHTTITAKQIARIAVYDNLLSAPRIVDIPPTDVATYIEQIASKTYELAQAAGGSIPYTVIREVSENFIHARFLEPTVSILDKGNTIRFADQGPGIENKDRVQLPGFTSATSDMKGYIRGVGSGLPIVKEYLKFSNGRLIIEDNISDGTVITITIEENASQPVVYQETAGQSSNSPSVDLPKVDGRSMDVLAIAAELGSIGPTDLDKELGIPVATGYRILDKLASLNLVETGQGRKRVLTDLGYKVLREGE